MAGSFRTGNSDLDTDINSPLLGGGEMGNRIRAFDWSSTPLGPISQWPLSLRSAVNLLLQSPAPLVILWGKAGITLYNNGYIDFAGARHPVLLGASCETIWPEAADFIQHVKTQCLGGASLSFKNHPHRVYRNNRPEDIWMDLYCSPLPDDGGQPAGVLIVNIETTDWVSATHALQESEERYRLILEGSNEGIWDYDVNSGTAFWNDRFFEILGYRREEVATPGFAFIKTLIHPQDREAVEKSIWQASTEGTLHEVEYRIRHRQGHYLYMRSKGKPVYNRQGQICRIAGVTRDITEQKLAEKALMESTERFRSIFNHSSVGIAQTDMQGTFMLVNERYCEIVGRSPQQLYQLRLQDITYPEDLQTNLSLLDNTLKAGKSFGLEKRYIRGDGSLVWVNINVSLVKDSAGTPLYILGVCQDITESRRTQDALQESEERFRTMADASGILIAQADITGNVIYLNQAWSSFTGRSMEELTKYGWAEFFHPEDSQAFVEAYQNAFEKREPLIREFRLLSHSGDYFWHLAVLSPLFGPNGTFSGYISSCIDISERKQAEKELDLKNKQLIRINTDLDNFIYTASHDLRSPILNLEGLLVALNKRLADRMTPGAATLLHMMDQSIEKLKRTIKDLTEITKAQKGLENNKEEVLFKELLDEITADLQEDIQQADPLIDENFEVASIYSSRANIRSILYNLITNALKYRASERRLEISIHTYAEDDFVVLSVQDNGLGISEQQLPKLFTMFKRMHTHVEGTGIGLYIIKRIVENKGGRIEVKSEVNGGSLFKVYLPAHT